MGETTAGEEKPQVAHRVTTAVLDANVYVSAVINPAGPPAQVLEQFLRYSAFEVVLSQEIAEEIVRALHYPKLAKYLPRGFHPERWVAEIALLSTFVPGDYRIQGVCIDPDDDKYIAAAVESGAQWLVTGDSELLAIKRYEDVEIVSPRSFMAIVKRR